MSGPVIIRLQNLPLEARSIDIRRFFEGLLIPDGGVHIIGGERGDAFIAFQSDEDARQAMIRNMKVLCGAQIQLFLSSKTEMQNVIASARQAPPVINNPPAAYTKPVANTNAKQYSSSNPLDFLLKNATNPAPQASQAPPKTDMDSAISQLTSSINPNILDQLKNINQMLPGLKTTQTPAPVVQPKPVEAQKTNISIDHILNILQSHLQPGQTAAPAISVSQSVAKKEPSPEPHYNTNSNRLNNIDKNGSNGNKYSTHSEEFNEENNSYRSKYDSSRNGSYNSSHNKYNNTNNETNYQSNRREYNERPQNNKQWNGTNNNSDNNNKYNKYSTTTAADTAQSAQRQTLDPIIRVRNFNTNCSYKDVRTFLQGIQIEHDGIKLLTDYTGQRNGSAFVKLISITDLKKALCRNKQFYEEKTIIVTQSTEVEFSTATNVYSFGANNNRNGSASNNTSQRDNKPYEKKTFNQEKITNQNELSEGGFFLKIYGLPVQFDETDLKAMFNNVGFIRITTSTPTPITSTNINNGVEETTTSLKAKKLCQVETQLDLERALTRQDERVGKSKLQIFQINKQEYDRELAYVQRTSNNGNNYHNESNKGFAKKLYTNNNVEDSPDDLFAHVSGLPFMTREEDVREFFEDLNIIAILTINDVYTLKPTGEFCCYFATKHDCDIALERDDEVYRSRNIKIKALNFNEYYQVAQKQLDLRRPNGVKRRVLLVDGPISSHRGVSNKVEDIPKHLAYNSNSSHNSNEDDEDDYQNGSRYNNNNRRDQSKRNINNSSNGPVNLMSLNSGYKRKNFESNGSSNQQYSNKRKAYNNYNEDSNSSPNPALPPLPAEFTRYRNRLILLSNIAYDASREDILGLVAGFYPLEQTLKIRHDDQGKPAGDAVIAFQTPDDANQAVSDLDGSYFMGDNIRATLFSS